MSTYRFTLYYADWERVCRFTTTWAKHKALGFVANEDALCYLAGVHAVHPPLHLLGRVS